MTTLTELINTSGLAVQKQNEIAQTLGIFFNKASEWDATIQSIVITSPEETGKMKMAREGRLTLKNMRLEADKLVKTKRDEVKYLMANFVLEDKLWLKAGQMIEATFKNLETKLEEKEKFAERWEAEQREKLRIKRLTELVPLGFNEEFAANLGDMDEHTYTALKTGLETEKIAREKAEEERIAREKAEVEERGRIRKENERLKAEAEAREKEIAAQRAEAEAKLKAAEAKARKEREAAEAKLKAESEKKLKAEREARARVEAELKAKAEAEAKARAEIMAKELAEKKAAEREQKLSQKTRLNRWVDSLTITAPVGMENDFTVAAIITLHNQFKLSAKQRISDL